MFSEYFSFILFSSLFLAIGWILWMLSSKDKAMLRTGMIVLAISLVANLALLILSTELIGNPLLELSLPELLPKFALPIVAVLTVAGFSTVAIWLRSRDRRKKQQNIPWLNIGWILGICLVSFAGLFWINSDLQAQPVEESSVEAETAVPRALLEVAAESLPEGFEIIEVLHEAALERPVAFTAAASGELYISTFFGGIYKLAPAPWNPDDPKLSLFYEDIEQVTGMVYYDGSLFANGSGSLIELRDEDLDGKAEVSTTLFEGLPSRIYDHHSNNGIVIGPDGRFYFGLGGTTDHGPETDPLAGNILVFDPADGSLDVYSSGHRNPYDLVFCPSNEGRLFSTDNAPDNLDDSLRYVPPDELNLTIEGKNYGYPDYFGFPPPWSDTQAPIALMETAGVPAGLECYEGDNFPSEYVGDLFVALAGGSNPVTGHKIVRVTVSESDGKTIGIVSDFLTNLGRPVDIIEYLDGTLLVLDYDLGQIYQIVYSGN